MTVMPLPEHEDGGKPEHKHILKCPGRSMAIGRTPKLFQLCTSKKLKLSRYKETQTQKMKGLMTRCHMPNRVSYHIWYVYWGLQNQMLQICHISMMADWLKFQRCHIAFKSCANTTIANLSHV